MFHRYEYAYGLEIALWLTLHRILVHGTLQVLYFLGTIGSTKIGTKIKVKQKPAKTAGKHK